MKHTTAEHDPQAADRLRHLIENISVAMITTVTPDGALRSRPMFTQALRGAGELWFFTSEESGKAHDIAGEHAVNVSYADPERDRYVSVSGQASLVHDRTKMHELWDPALARYFPQGPDTPQLALLCVRIETAEYWDATAGGMQPLHDHDSTAAGNESGSSNQRRTRAGGEHAKVDIRAARSSG